MIILHVSLNRGYTCDPRPPPPVPILILVPPPPPFVLNDALEKKKGKKSTTAQLLRRHETYSKNVFMLSGWMDGPMCPTIIKYKTRS